MLNICKKYMQKIKNNIYNIYMNSKCTSNNYYYLYIIFSIGLIGIVYFGLSSNLKTDKKYIKLLIKLDSQDNFTNMDNNNIKDNHKLMYWIAPLNNDVNNNKGSFDNNSGVTNILNNGSMINIDCTKNNDIAKYVHYRIVDSDGKLSGVYMNKNNISNMCN